ncbi:hypothetical protein ACQKWADRAFT_294826 [Trichoderma austrokoningii]
MKLSMLCLGAALMPVQKSFSDYVSPLVTNMYHPDYVGVYVVRASYNGKLHVRPKIRYSVSLGASQLSARLDTKNKK